MITKFTSKMYYFFYRSRLGCQIILEEKLDGLEVQVPATVNDARYN